jgi:hypothetical protein
MANPAVFNLVMARQSHIRVSRPAVISFLSSTWGRADQQTSQDSNRVWDVLFCAQIRLGYRGADDSRN